MPNKSGVTFTVQPVVVDGNLSGYVVSGFFNANQLVELRRFVDSEEYERSKRWRGQYQEMAKAIVDAIDSAVTVEH